MIQDQQNIITEIVNKIDPICCGYFNTSLIEKDGKTYPVYPTGSGFDYVGLSDTKCLNVYIRKLSDSDFKKIDVAGCSNIYNITYKYRIVVSGKNKSISTESIAANVLRILMSYGAIMKYERFDKYGLFNSEQSGHDKNVFFTNNDIYFGYDFDIVKRQGIKECIEDLECEVLKYKICDHE